MSPLADQSLNEILDALAAADAGPAAGVAAAATCAQAAALVELTAGLAARRSRAGDGTGVRRMEEIAVRAAALRGLAASGADDDVAAYGAIRGLAGAERAAALSRAADVPAGLAAQAAETAGLAAEVAGQAAGAAWAADVQAATVLAQAAGVVASLLVTVNRAAATGAATGGGA